MEPGWSGAMGCSPQGSSPPRHGHSATEATSWGGGASGPEDGNGTSTACGPTAAAAVQDTSLQLRRRRRRAAGDDNPAQRLGVEGESEPRRGLAAARQCESDGGGVRGAASAWATPPQLMCENVYELGERCFPKRKARQRLTPTGRRPVRGAERTSRRTRCLPTVACTGD